jgi:hypothetical protein
MDFCDVGCEKPAAPRRCHAGQSRKSGVFGFPDAFQLVATFTNFPIRASFARIEQGCRLDLFGSDF